MAGVTAEGGGKAGRLGDLAVCVLGLKDGVLGVRNVGVDAWKPDGENWSRLSDAGVIETG